MSRFAIGLTNRLHASTDGPPCYAGTLVLGDDVERLACTAGAWTAGDYRRQWLAAARQLATGPRARTAFVIAVGRAHRVIEWWPAHRDGRRVVFHNQLPLDLHLPRARLGATVPQRRAGAWRGSPGVSEWVVPYSSIEQWARSSGARPASSTISRGR